MSFVVDKCYAYLHGVSNLYTVGMFIVTCKLWIVRLVDNRVGLATWRWEEEKRCCHWFLYEERQRFHFSFNNFYFCHKKKFYPQN